MKKFLGQIGDYETMAAPPDYILPCGVVEEEVRHEP